MDWSFVEVSMPFGFVKFIKARCIKHLSVLPVHWVTHKVKYHKISLCFLKSELEVYGFGSHQCGYTGTNFLARVLSL